MLAFICAGVALIVCSIAASGAMYKTMNFFKIVPPSGRLIGSVRETSRKLRGYQMLAWTHNRAPLVG